MQVALLGGTGDIGEGLALRLARDTDHEVIVGSRQTEKAEDAAAAYEATLADHGVEAAVGAAENPEAAAGAEVVVLSVPAYHLADTVETVADTLSGMLVSPAVGLQRDEAGLHYNPPGVGSVTALAAQAAPDGVPVVGAYHNLAAGRLGDLDADLDWDVPVVADDEAAKETVVNLTDEMAGLRALDAGPLANATEVESLTPLLINLAANNEELHDLGAKFL
ncbi:MAG: NADPH-dependent F420 reductase [Natronomonas sp.]|jgi:NADPH-dependent F420 reductase